MYWIHNEGKSVVAERLIKKLITKIYKYMTSIWKNVYIDKLDNKVNEYNNTYHRTSKTKPVDVKHNTYIDFKKEVNDKDPKLKVGDHVRISKYKNVFAKGYTPNCSEEVFVIKKAKNTVPWTYVINDLNGEEIIGTYHGKELQKSNQQKFRIEKVIKKNGDKLYFKWKDHDNSFNSWIDKKGLVWFYRIEMSQYFPNPYEPFGGDINVKVDLSNYATKTDIENIAYIDTSSFALKSNLASLKTDINKLDIDKLAPVPLDFSKLSDMVKKDVVKINVYDKLVAKVNRIDNSAFALKTKYNTDKTELEKKISGTSGLVKKADYNIKITEIECKIPNVSSLVTKTALTTAENKIPDVSSLVKKTDYNTKVTEIEKKLTDHIMINILQLQSLIL